MVDPLGIAWLSDTRGAKTEPSWDWLANPQANPLWRSRVALAVDKRLQFLIAAVHVGLVEPFTDALVARPALEWLEAVRHQARPDGRRFEMELLSGRAAAAVIWQSEYQRARRLVPGLEFVVPIKGTFVERHGAALVTDSFHEKEALQLLAALRDGRGAAARAAGLVPLEEAERHMGGKGAWRLAVEGLPIAKSIEAELEKMP
jgi:spermidine/putrescine-binding protein